MQSAYEARLVKNTEQLKKLLGSPSIKYSDWPPNDNESLKFCAGIYHFYEVKGELVESMYIGKAGFGKTNSKWSLYSRLKQHFQPSQRNTLLGKASKVANVTSDQMRNQFNERSIYLQWIVLGDRTDKIQPELISELLFLEYFAIAILQPKYTES